MLLIINNENRYILINLSYIDEHEAVIYFITLSICLILNLMNKLYILINGKSKIYIYAIIYCRYLIELIFFPFPFLLLVIIDTC